MAAYDAVVVGVGSMGSAAAYHLAARGARVLGLEQFDVPNALGSSVGVDRIIRLAYAEHPDYVPLLRRAYALWRELETLARERLLFVTGGVDAGRPDGAAVTGSLRACREHHLPHEVLDARALARRFAGFRLPPELVAVYQPDGGFLMSERCVAVHVGAALAAGAEIHGRERVLAWEPRGAGVHVRTERAAYEARRLVLCAGPWTARLLPTLAPLAVPERQVLMWAQPRRPELFGLGQFPVFNLEAAEGRFYGGPVHAVPGVKIGKYHHRRERVDPDAVDRAAHPEDEAVLRAALARYFPDADGPALALKVCMFTNSPDEHFLLDRHPEHAEVVVAAGFSGHGFKFCSVVGEIVADLALTGATAWKLDLFRLSRFAARAPGGPPAPRRD
ncbi:MAG TPA: N-methyl-L-tryptophan oxidase [Methylomirabilota bacterium]|nr:N-methyl-L-tryptophan oxidase [Methylomirabilota bacterium]